jgi:hypothetical protein
MSLEKTAHVLGLSVREQILLRLLLYNLMAGYIHKSIMDAPWVSPDELALKDTNALKFFERYTDFCDMLCPESMLAKGRPKLMMVGTTLMKYLVIAVNGYDASECYLTDDQKRVLESQFVAFKEKILDSSKFLYTSWEVEKMKNTK